MKNSNPWKEKFEHTINWIKKKLRNLNRKANRKYPLFRSLFDEKREDNLQKSLFRLLKLSAAAAACILFINTLLIFLTDKGGVFGDFFGGMLNPILTFITFICLIFTIVIQRQELRLARTEFEKTADALRTQAIETTFFSILDLHHKIVENLRVDINELANKEKPNSLNAFDLKSKKIKTYTESKRQFELLKALLEKGPEELSPSDFKELEEKRMFIGREVFDVILIFISKRKNSNNERTVDIIKNYKKIQILHNDIMGHYFRNLYQALKLIDKYEDNHLSQEKKRKYASILRSQLSTKELILLFINCLDGVSDKGEFKNLLIDYCILEHLPIEVNDFPPKHFKIKGFPIRLPIDTLHQYEVKKKIPETNNDFFGGAFGKNPGIPTNLKKNTLQ